MTDDEITRSFFIDVRPPEWYPPIDIDTLLMNAIVDATSLAITRRWSAWETKLSKSPPEDWKMMITVTLRKRGV